MTHCTIEKRFVNVLFEKGSRLCNIKSQSMAHYMYDKNNKIYERHRHRYEVNPEFIELFEKNGLNFTGKDIKNERMEIFELDRKSHKFFIGCQFHPEFLSGPLRPSPIFNGFIQASSGILYEKDSFKKYFGIEKKNVCEINDNNLLL